MLEIIIGALFVFSIIVLNLGVTVSPKKEHCHYFYYNKDRKIIEETEG